MRNVIFVFTSIHLCLIPSLAFAADTTSNTENPAPTAKVIRDAPSLQIPAMPFSKTTLTELGYTDVEDLLKQSLQAQSEVNAIAFSKDGKLLASGSSDGTVKLWDVASGELQRTLKGHERAATTVAFDGSGVLASGSLDGTVKLWDVASGELQQTLKAGGGILGVQSVAFDGSGVLASGSSDGTVKLWDTSKTSPKTKLSSRTLLARATGSWLSISSMGDVLRAGAGRILRKAELLDQGKVQIKVKKTERDKDGKRIEKWLDKTVPYSSTRWHYLPAPNTPVARMQLAEYGEIVADSPHSVNSIRATDALVLISGQVHRIYIKLKNTDTHNAIQRPQIVIPKTSQGSVQVVPVNHTMRYPQTTGYHTKSSLIPAGGSVVLEAGLFISSNSPVKSGKLAEPLLIKVDSVNGGSQTVKFNITLQTPDVQVTESNFNTENKTLSVLLKNSGTAALQKTLFYLTDGKQKLDIPTQTLDSITASSETALAFSLPDSMSAEQRKALQLKFVPLAKPNYSNWQVSLDIKSSRMWMLYALASLLLLAFTVFYFRRYRHPLVLSLGENSERLLQLPLEQLPEAQRRLEQTNRLAKVLSDVEVGKQTLQTAIGFMGLELDEKIEVIASRTHAQLPSRSHAPAWERPALHSHTERGNEVVSERALPRAGSGIYLLNLSNTFPLNINRLQFFFPNDLAVEDVFSHLKNTPQTQNHITVIIGKDSEYQRKLHAKTSDTTNKWVAPLGYELTHLLLSQNAETVLAEILAGQLSLQQISPYRIGGGVSNESLFFGRREMISQIINRDPANYLIVGGRQVGKSTLLKALERRYAENGQVVCHYLSLSSEVLVSRLASLLKLEKTTDPEVLASSLEALMHESGQHYVFLIDEADKFIEHEQQQDYPILQVFRRLSEQGGCSFILGGFWQLYQHAVLDYQSPIRNFGELIQVGALEYEACLQLASVPMQSMQLEYANQTLLELLVAECGQRANLITKTCQTIVTNLPVKQRTIEAGDVHNALHSDVIRKELTGWVIGNNELEQQYDRLVVYATITMDDFSTGELITLLQDKGVKLDIAELERTLSRLEMAFVLGRNAGRWSYRVPLFVAYMQEESPELKLAAELL